MCNNSQFLKFSLLGVLIFFFVAFTKNLENFQEKAEDHAEPAQIYNMETCGECLNPRNHSAVNYSAEIWQNLVNYENDLGRVTDGIWQPVNEFSDRFYVYSAFHDTRFRKYGVHGFVRVLAAVPSYVLVEYRELHGFNQSIWCEFHWDDERVAEEAVGNGFNRVEATVSQMWPWGIKRAPPAYADAFIYCPSASASAPNSVSISSSTSTSSSSSSNRLIVHTLSRIAAPGALSICVQPFRGGYAKTAQLVEFVEFHASVGATSFHFYGGSYSGHVDCVLRYYMTQRSRGIGVFFHSYEIPYGLATNEANAAFPWHFPAVANNDCLYRAIGKAEMVATIDLDELLVPPGDYTLPDFIQKLKLETEPETLGGVYFERKLMPMEFPDDENAVEEFLPLIIFRKTLPSPVPKLVGKTVVFPEHVVTSRTHYITYLPDVKHLRLSVEQTGAVCFHYRDFQVGNAGAVLARFNLSDSERDRRVLRFRDQLKTGLNHFLKHVPEKCGLNENLWGIFYP